MAKIEDGGPAFPGTHLEEFWHTDPDTEETIEVERELKAAGGMSLRDWFAGQIAAAAMTNAEGLGAMSK